LRIYFKPIFKAKAYGVKCDKCWWRDRDVNEKEYKDYVDKPCPNCGENLMTHEDYILAKIIMIISKLLGWIRIPSTTPPKKFIMKKQFGRWRTIEENQETNGKED